MEIWKRIGKIGFKHGIYLRFTLEATEVASFITFIGSEALDIHPGLPFTSKEDKGRIDSLRDVY